MTLRLGTDLDDRELIEALRSRPNHWAATAADYPDARSTLPVRSARTS